MSKEKEQDHIDVAFKILEGSFVRYRNAKSDMSNAHHLGHPNREEHDLSESEKEHLALLRSKLHMEIARKLDATLIESSKSSDRLGRKIWWLNFVVVLLTMVIAISAILELNQ